MPSSFGDCAGSAPAPTQGTGINAPITNRIEEIQPVDYFEWCRFRTGSEVPPFVSYLVNGSFNLFREQSIWTSPTTIVHAREMIGGDTVYDDHNADMAVTSISETLPDEDFVRIWTGTGDTYIFRPGTLCGNKTAAELVAGDDATLTLTIDGETVLQPVHVTSVAPVKGWLRFLISGDHSFIADGITLHNASRFWVGGTGTWDNAATTHWSATTGGAAGSSAPSSSDDVTFDANSGGGTVTPNAALSINNFTCGAFTGTLAFNTNNNNITVAGTFSNSSSIVRTLSLGNGTWSMTRSDGTSPWSMNNVTNLTFNANSSTVNFTSTYNANIVGVSLSAFNVTSTFNIVTFSGAMAYGFSSSGQTAIGTLNITGSTSINIGADHTITTLSPTAGIAFQLAVGAGVVLTVTNAFSFVGSQANPFVIGSVFAGTQGTISIASGTCKVRWAIIRGIIFTGGATFIANDSLASAVTGITVNTPMVRNPSLVLGI